jgi:phage gp46-like protein
VPALSYDLGITDEAYDVNGDLRTYITLALLSNAQAQPGDVIPDASDRQGWWAQVYFKDAAPIYGSRLWTLHGRGITPELLQSIDEMSREALQPLITERVVTAFDVRVEQVAEHMVGIQVGVRRGRDTSLTWLDTWKVSLASI